MSSAHAAPPVWVNPLPIGIRLVGCGPAGPDSASGHIRFRIVDLYQMPIPNSLVVLDFHYCTGVTLAMDQQDPRLVVNCAARTVSTRSDVGGYASFTVMGSGTAGPADAGSNLRVYADGVLLGTLRLAALERDRLGGLTLADLAIWAADYFGDANPDRANFDFDPHVSLADLAIWAQAYFSGNDAVSPGPYCP